MKRSAVLSVFLLLLVVENGYSSKQCNLYNLGVKGVYPCALTWWQTTDWSEQVTFSPNATQIISNALEAFGIEVDDINRSFGDAGLPDANSTNILSKIIESALVVEPLAMYMVADGIEGFDLTEDELAKLNLPALLANRENLKVLYQDYFSTSCAEEPVASFSTCVDDWMTENCNTKEDKTEVITAVISGVTGFFCTDQKTLKPDVKKTLDESLGEVWTPIARKLFDVVKDPDSAYVFNISSSSWLLNMSVTRELVKKLTDKCLYVSSSIIDIDELSSVGAGNEVQRTLNDGVQFTACLLDIFKEYVTLNDIFQKPVNHLNQMFPPSIYRFQDIFKQKKPFFQNMRMTTAVYGLSQMSAYQSRYFETCSVQGWQTYVSNSRYTLQARKEMACLTADEIPCNLTYVSEISLQFHNENIEYNSSDSTAFPANTLTAADGSAVAEYGDIVLTDLGGPVMITDNSTGVVFMFDKYKEMYIIGVRQTVSMLESSTGLLISGCSAPVDLYDYVGGYGYRRYEDCSDSCRNATAGWSVHNWRIEYSCRQSCLVTGDIEWSEAAQKMRSMLIELRGKDVLLTQDDELLPAEKDKDSPPADEDKGEGKGGDSSAAEFTLSAVLLLTALVINIIM